MSIQTGAVQSVGELDNGQGGPTQASGQQQTVSPTATVNQTVGDAATQNQHHHQHQHPHDPYASAYPHYVPYGAPYNAGINTLPPYYAHDPSSHHGRPSSEHEPHSEPRILHDQHSRPPAAGPSSTHPLVPQLPPSRSQTASQAEATPAPTGESHRRSPAPYQASNATPSHDSSLRNTSPNPLTAVDSPGGAKRAYENNGTAGDAHQSKRARRTTMGTADGELEVLRDDNDVGPSGGPKHWTDEEKGRLFHWMLDDDERWEAFGTKMNTIFREGSAQLFQSRKSFTALKSCYHRNLEIFKQIYVFEAFLARAPISAAGPTEVSNPNSSSSTNEPSQTAADYNEIAALPMPPVFTTATERHNFLERKLEAAKALNVPVSNLTIKVIDHWFDMGWFMLFKKRFHEDPKTGLPIPQYSNDRLDADADAEGEEVPEDEQAPHGGASVAEARRRHLDPNGCLIPPPFPNPIAASRSAPRSQRTSPPPDTPIAGPSASQQPPPFTQGPAHYPHSAQSSPQLPYGYPGPIHVYSPPNLTTEFHMQQQHSVHLQMQTAQALTHLTNLTQTLLETCNTLVGLVKAQAEDIRAQTELLKRKEEREESASRDPERLTSTGGVHLAQPEAGTSRTNVGDVVGRDNRALLATEILANPQVGDEVRHAAAEYLKRVFR